MLFRSKLGMLLDRKAEQENAKVYVDKLNVRTPSLTTPIRNLSGGNQQKVILARWLSEHIRAIMLDEPTRGIDIGAKSEIYGIIQDLAKSGVAVLIVSSELPEVMGISDRILVMREGELVGEVSREEATEEKLLAMALPQQEEVA